MSKARFITQKVIIGLMMFASTVTVVPLILMILEHLVWINDPEDSLLSAISETLQTKSEDI